MRAREPLPAALVRAGLDAGEAGQVAQALADDFDIVNPRPGLVLSLSLAGIGGSPAKPRLAALELAPRDGERLRLWRASDGALRLRRYIAAPVAVTSPGPGSGARLTQGVIHGSLYLSLVEAGATPEMAASVSGLFGRRLDLARDIESGDPFRLVFAPGGQSGGRGEDDLLYADITTRAGTSRLYRDRPDAAGHADWIDGEGEAPGPALLRTPLDATRVVTSPFGLRLHPLLGFTRMHQGVDFGAAIGTAVLAAGDGVVEETRWAGGYGRWLKIRHAGALETGYGHLSAWAPRIFPGALVRQGQVVAYVGSSGLTTGPHLHYEVFRTRRRIDPGDAAAISGAMMITAAGEPARDRARAARRAIIDATVASLTAIALPGLRANEPGRAG